MHRTVKLSLELANQWSELHKIEGYNRNIFVFSWVIFRNFRKISQNNQKHSNDLLITLENFGTSSINWPKAWDLAGLLLDQACLHIDYLLSPVHHYLIYSPGISLIYARRVSTSLLTTVSLTVTWYLTAKTKHLNSLSTRSTKANIKVVDYIDNALICFTLAVYLK